MSRRSFNLLCCAVLLSLAGGASAAPITLGFEGITNNDPGDVLIGQQQLAAEVYVGGNEVSFTFLNSGPEASSITDIYFEDHLGLTYQGISSSAGVSFSPGAAPPNLPGGKPYGFDTAFSADSNPPVVPNGVNDPNEWLTIVFNLENVDYAQIETALANEALRVGVRVQGFVSGGSESFVSFVPAASPPMPEPGSALLFGVGSVVVGVAVRHKLRGAEVEGS